MLRLGLLVLLFGSASWAWSPRDQTLYSQRHFVELAHVLVMQKHAALAKKILEQEHDLRGCRAIHRGVGSLSSLLDCARFINRESELKFKASEPTGLVRDINLLCGRLVSEPNSLQKILDSTIFSAKNWFRCNQMAWRQVYLTVYANFDADPSGSLSLLRRAEAALGTHSPWATQSAALFQPKAEVWPRF